MQDGSNLDPLGPVIESNWDSRSPVLVRFDLNFKYIFPTLKGS